MTKVLSLQDYCGDILIFMTYFKSYKNKKRRRMIVRIGVFSKMSISRLSNGPYLSRCSRSVADCPDFLCATPVAFHVAQLKNSLFFAACTLFFNLINLVFTSVLNARKIGACKGKAHDIGI